MSKFKELSTPEIENGNSVHKDKWYVFINSGDHSLPEVDDDRHFLHKDGKRLCKLRTDKENGRIMFETQLEAFDRSIEFYTYHNETYPWIDEYMVVFDKTEDNGDATASQIMRFD